MQWTRMTDGSYYAVARTYGKTYSYTVRRTGRPSEKRTVWTLHVNDKHLQNADGPEGTTCEGAKSRARAHFAEMCRQGKPLIKVL